MTTSHETRGYALVSVLWLVTLLAAITASYHASARTEAKLLAGTLHRAQAEALAEAGIWIAVHEHFMSGPTTSSSTANIQRRVVFHDAQIEVTLADPSGKINLNNAQSELLAALLARTNVAPAELSTLVDAILDWRDLDDMRQPQGAEDADYARAGVDHGAKDAPFATVDELRYVRGMTETVYREVAPALTVYGGHSRVNLNAAPASVLRVLPGANDGVVAAILRARETDGDEASDAGGLDPQFAQQASEDISTVAGTATVSGVTTRIEATLRYTRGESEPVQVLGWISGVGLIEASNAEAPDAR